MEIAAEAKPEETACEVKTEKTPVEEEKTDGQDKAEVTKSEETKNGETKNEEIKSEEIKSGEIKSEEVKSEEVKSGEIKSEEKPSEPPSEELLEKIKSQVEFYFGDINLQRDKFLIEQQKLDDGWIPMTVMLKFQLLASLSADPEVILKSVENSDLIEISEDRKSIRRSPAHPLPVYDEAYRKAQAERTVYIKGFPLEDIYIQKIKEFLKDYEPFENVVLRKYQDKDKKLKFKGSIFVQFTTLEGAKAFMARESVKYNDVELVRKFSEEYAVEKAKEKEERKLKKGDKKTKKTDENDQVSEPEGEENDKINLPKGSTLLFTCASSDVSREAIKVQLVNLGAEVAYIDFAIGNVEGWVRLQEAGSAKVILEKMEDQKILVNNHELKFRSLEGEEETAYLTKVAAMMKERRAKFTRGNPNKRGNKRGGRFDYRGKKRTRSPAGDGVSAKKKNAA